MNALFDREQSLEKQSAGLQNAVFQQDQEIIELKAQLAKLKSETQTMQAETALAKKEADSLQQQSINSDAEIARIEERIKGEQAWRREISGHLAETEKELKTVEEQIALIIDLSGGGGGSAPCFAGDTLVLMADSS